MKSKSKKASLKNSPIQQNIRNTPVVKASPQEDVILQFGGNDVSVAAITDKAKQDYQEKSSGAVLKDIKVYVKPEDNKAYYVANGETEGSVDLI